MADATTIAAWVGALGTVANAGAIVWVRRSETTPADHLEMIPEPEERDHPDARAYGHQPRSAQIRLHLQGPGGYAVAAAGLQRKGTRRRRFEVPGWARSQGHEIGRQLPHTKEPGRWFSILLPMRELHQAGVTRGGTYRAYVKPSNGRRLYSPWGSIDAAYTVQAWDQDDRTGRSTPVPMTDAVPKFLTDEPPTD